MINLDYETLSNRTGQALSNLFDIDTLTKKLVKDNSIEEIDRLFFVYINFVSGQCFHFLSDLMERIDYLKDKNENEKKEFFCPSENKSFKGGKK